MLPAAREAGVLPSGKLPLDDRHEAVSALDVGRVAAELLFDPRPGTRIVDLAGPAPYSALDAAAILSRLLGKPVTAVPSSREQSVAALVAAGLGADYAEKLADLDEAINAGRLDFPPGGEMRRGHGDARSRAAASGGQVAGDRSMRVFYATFAAAVGQRPGRRHLLCLLVLP